MQGYGFSDHLQQVLSQAREQAIARNQAMVAPEHMLLAIARDGSGLACAALENLQIDLVELVRRLDAENAATQSHLRVVGPDLPYTVRAKTSLELAIETARDLDCTYVGTEHLLLGVLREGESIAAHLVTEMGAPLDRVQGEILQSIKGHASPVKQRDAHADVRSVVVEIRKTDGTVVKQEFGNATVAVAFLATQM